MRSTMIAMMLCALVPACGGTVTAETADPPPDSAGGATPPGVRLEPWLAAGAGGGASAATAATSTTSTTTSTTSTGAGSAAWSGTPPCVFGVTGAFDAWVDNPSVEGWVWWVGDGGQLQCSGTVGGVYHTFTAPLGSMHGPGQYTSTGTYTRAIYESTSAGEEWVSGQQFSSAPNETTCVFELTTAPETNQAGATVAGSFFCGTLVGDEDATQVVTIYDGSFSGQLIPPPQ